MSAPQVVIRPQQPKGVCSVCSFTYRDGPEPATHAYCKECLPIVTKVDEHTLAELASQYGAECANLARNISRGPDGLTLVGRAFRRFRFMLRQLVENHRSEVKELERRARPLGWAVVARDQEGRVRHTFCSHDGEPWDQEDAEKELVGIRRRHRNQRGLEWSVHTITIGG